jgi:predicted nucleic acid-binding protein
LSIVAKIELLGWQFANAEDEAKAESFIADSIVLALSDTIAEKTIELRRLKKLKLGDAIIAATAMIHDMTLLTRNSADFNGLPGLEVVNPFEI